MAEPRLALVAPSFSLLSETFIADHARRLAPGRTVLVCQDSRGAEVHGAPVLSHLSPEPVAYGPRDAQAKDVLFRLRRRWGPALPFDSRQRLAAFLRAQGVTVVLAEYGFTGALVADVCRDLDLPLSVLFHGVDASAHLRLSLTLRRYRHMFPLATNLIAVSRYLADRLVAVGAPAERMHVVPCGVDPARFPPGRPEPGRVVVIGRLTEKKAPHLAIRAFAAAVADGRFPGAHLDVVGDGPLRDACVAAVAETGLKTGLGAQVTLHGPLPHARVGELMRRAQVFLQHSVTAANGDTEGAPVAVAEAMMTALPVVATRHSGIPEQVAEGETGLLVAEGDVAGMGAALARLLADPAASAAMGAAGRVRALERLDQDRLYAELRSLLGLPQPEAG